MVIEFLTQAVEFNLGCMMGFEPTHIGITIRGLDRLTTRTILKHTQLSALDSLLLLGACSNVLQYGATRRIRTSHPCVRSTVLYPNELWSLVEFESLRRFYRRFIQDLPAA